MLGGPEWARFVVTKNDENGKRWSILGGTINAGAAAKLWEFFAGENPQWDIQLQDGARVIRRSKPGWKL